MFNVTILKLAKMEDKEKTTRKFKSCSESKEHLEKLSTAIFSHLVEQIFGHIPGVHCTGGQCRLGIKRMKGGESHIKSEWCGQKARRDCLGC